jgi:hypothetical protein
VSDLLEQHVRNVLEANFAFVTRTRRRVEELEAQGHRVISGGMIGQDAWDIVDWRTNEILAAGAGGADELAAAARELDPDGTFVHYDSVVDDEDAGFVSTPGLPAGLAETVEEWVLDGDADEIAGFIGWPVEKVIEYQAED